MKAARSNVVEIIPEARVNEAWDEWAAIHCRYLAEPELGLDRQFMQQHAQAMERFERIYNRWVRGQ